MVTKCGFCTETEGKEDMMSICILTLKVLRSKTVVCECDGSKEAMLNCPVWASIKVLSALKDSTNKVD